MNEELYNGYLVEAGGETYLAQGDTDDSLHMVRNVDNLLECENDAVQVALRKGGME